MPTPNTTVVQLSEVADDVKSVADYRIFPVLLESMLFSLYMVLMAFHCLKHWRTGEKATGIFAICICLYAMCAITWALDVSIMSLELYQLLPSRISPEGSSMPIDKALSDLNGNIEFARAICEQVIFVFCDTISLWRAYVLYGRPTWLKMICLFSFGLSSILYTLDMILIFPNVLATPPAYTAYIHASVDDMAGRALSSAALSTTALSQIFATMLIARIALLHRKHVQRLLTTHKGAADPDRPMATLYIVIETGIIYSLIWILFVLSNLSVLGKKGDYWSDHWICPVSGIYPTLVVVIVSLRTSILERSVIDAPRTTTDTVSLRFADNEELKTVVISRPDINGRPVVLEEDITESVHSESTS